MNIKSEAKARLLQKMAALLSEYHHRNTVDGLNEILRVWNENKSPLMDLFARHPNWDAENFRIVFSQDYTRSFESDAIEEFIEWAKNAYRNEVFAEDTVDGMSFRDFDKKADALSDIVDRLDTINHALFLVGEESDNVVLNGITYSEWRERWREARAKVREFRNSHSYLNTLSIWTRDDEVNNGTYTPYNLARFFRAFQHVNSNIVDENVAARFNGIFPDLNVGVGTKIMKVVRKVCIAYGLDKVVQMETREWDTTDPNTGEVTHHTREVNMGYNGQIAKLGDRINPFKIKRHTIVSLNPLDYLTMSFGYKWASCQTIDKENDRGVDDHNYEGMYCSGTLSYMLDGVTFLVATFDSSYEGNEFETQDKLQRCMFHINTDFNLLLQGRVYPDGRDGGDESLAGQFRQIVQKVITDCTGENNNWLTKPACTSQSRWISRGTHYRDYEHYSDCSISFLKREEVKDYTGLVIGHAPICPVCGREHGTAGWLCCDVHSEIRVCASCGDEIDGDDYIHCDDNDNYYCCDRCAERDDVHFCEDDDEWHDEDHCWQDAYNDNWYHGVPDVIAEDGSRFWTCDNATEAGYVSTDDGWYPEDACQEDIDGEWFRRTRSSIEADDGTWFRSAEQAEQNGYSQDDSGVWRREYEEVA